MKNAKTAARKSHIIRVMSSSLGGWFPEKNFPLLFIEFWIIKKQEKKTSKFYNQLTHSDPNWLLLVQLKINTLKTSDFTAVAQKEGDKC